MTKHPFSFAVDGINRDPHLRQSFDSLGGANMIASRLRFRHKWALSVLAAVLFEASASLVSAQTPAPTAAQGPAAQAVTIPEWQTAAGGKLSFDVASIRPTKPDEFTPPNFPLSSDNAYAETAGLFTADFPLFVYIEFAYKFLPSNEQREAMLAHLPKWVGTENFEIHARATGNPTKDQMRLMMQSLLAERFKLKIHFERKDSPVLAMVLEKPGKTGPNLRPHSEGPRCPDTKSSMIPTTADVFPPICDAYLANLMPGHPMKLGSRNTTMALIASSLPTVEDFGRPVVDQTGLTGRYDFVLQWTHEPKGGAPSTPSTTEDDSQKISFQQALKEQLGLKLKAATAPLSVAVVDHIERPSEN
jgi:bla regulator protein BlaR1